MEIVAITLIYIHAFFGGLGLIAGIITALGRKGDKIHKKSGKVFSISMLVSSLLSLVICTIPKHNNSFLFLIGIFTIYLIVTGNRALHYRVNLKASLSDQIISAAMCLSSVIMLLFGSMYLKSNFGNSLLFFFFGAFGLYMSLKDFRFYAAFTAYSKNWLPQHISKISGAVIASITALLVAGLQIKNAAAWLLPTLIGTLHIQYWIRKARTKSIK